MGVHPKPLPKKRRRKYLFLVSEMPSRAEQALDLVDTQPDEENKGESATSVSLFCWIKAHSVCLDHCELWDWDELITFCTHQTGHNVSSHFWEMGKGCAHVQVQMPLSIAVQQGKIVIILVKMISEIQKNAWKMISNSKVPQQRPFCIRQSHLRSLFSSAMVSSASSSTVPGFDWLLHWRPDPSPAGDEATWWSSAPRDAPKSTLGIWD